MERDPHQLEYAAPTPRKRQWRAILNLVLIIILLLFFGYVLAVLVYMSFFFRAIDD